LVSKPMAAIDDLNSQRFYHGTKADLKPGGLIAPGYKSNFDKRQNTVYVYLTRPPYKSNAGSQSVQNPTTKFRP